MSPYFANPKGWVREFRGIRGMRETTISRVIETVYAQWPDAVDTSEKRGLGTSNFKIVGVWEIYEHVNDRLDKLLKNYRELLMAQVINWAIFKVVSEIGKTADVVRPSAIPRTGLLSELESCAHEPTLQPEIVAIVRYVRDWEHAGT